MFTPLDSHYLHHILIHNGSYTYETLGKCTEMKLNQNTRTLATHSYTYNTCNPIRSITVAQISSQISDDYYYFGTIIKLVYYNYRYYSAELGRWLNRDPIEEYGGYNLYAMLENSSIDKWDVLGHAQGNGIVPAIPIIPGLEPKNPFPGLECLGVPIMTEYKKKFIDIIVTFELSIPPCTYECPYLQELHKVFQIESVWKGLCRKKGSKGPYKDMTMDELYRITVPYQKMGCVGGVPA